MKSAVGGRFVRVRQFSLNYAKQSPCVVGWQDLRIASAGNALSFSAVTLFNTRNLIKDGTRGP